LPTSSDRIQLYHRRVPAALPHPPAVAYVDRVSPFRPMPLARRRDPCDDPAWLFQVKLDGFRALAFVDRGQCRLVSRNGPELALALHRDRGDGPGPDSAAVTARGAVQARRPSYGLKPTPALR